MHKTFFSIHFVSKLDSGYLRFCSFHREIKNINRHETIADISNEKGMAAENFAKEYLSRFIRLQDKTILSYIWRNERGQLLKCYREIDAVSQLDKDTVIIYEIKSSNKVKALKKAGEQLRITGDILKYIFKKVIKCIVIVKFPETDTQHVDNNILNDEFFYSSKKYKKLHSEPYKDFGDEGYGVLFIEYTS